MFESSRLSLFVLEIMVLRFWKVTVALSVERKDAEECEEAPSSLLSLFMLLRSIIPFL